MRYSGLKPHHRGFFFARHSPRNNIMNEQEQYEQYLSEQAEVEEVEEMEICEGAPF